MSDGHACCGRCRYEERSSVLFVNFVIAHGRVLIPFKEFDRGCYLSKS